MKKTARNIIIMLVIVLVLAGAGLLLLYTEPKDTEETASAEPVSSEPTVVLVDKQDSDVQSVTVKNTEVSYQIIPTAAQADTGTAASETSAAETIVFQIADYENYAVKEAEVTTAAGSLLSLTASKSLGAQEDLDKFGLAGDGEATIELKYHDGSADLLVFGLVPGESSGRYVLKDGQVYVVSSVSEKLFETFYSFFELSIIDIPDLTELDAEGSEAAVADVLNSVKLSGENYPEPIEIIYDETYLMVSPMRADSATQAVTDMITALKTVTADAVVYAGTEETMLARYGLDIPAAKVEYDMNGETHEIAVSERDSDGNRYLTADGESVIYQITDTAVSDWASVSVVDLRSPYIVLPNIMGVQKLTLDVAGQATVFEIERTINEEKTTETNTQYDLTVQCDGAAIDYEVYQPFYKQLLSVAVLSYDVLEYDGTSPYLTVTYEFFDGSEAAVIKFFPVEEKDRYIAELDGSYTGTVRSSQIDELITVLKTTAKNQAAE